MFELGLILSKSHALHFQVFNAQMIWKQLGLPIHS